jgi:aminopeptidase N
MIIRYTPFRSILTVFVYLMVSLQGPALFSQEPTFTRQDTLRGSVTPERAWWDLSYYHLEVTPGLSDSSLTGTVGIHYTVLSAHPVMQIDLQPPMEITAVAFGGSAIPFERSGNVYYLRFDGPQEVGSAQHVVIHFAGKPKVSLRPPWDGGVVWDRDEKGHPFIATACQGDGASLWWPCKDHMYDEPDSMLMSFTVPEDLTAVGNGRLRKADRNKKEKTRTFHWFVSSPISNYVVNMNIGDYVHFSEQYPGEKGALDCDYYVLSYNFEKAKKHFLEVPRMLEAFEHWFGPYPFYEDGYKLVEVPYPGMEHQSSVTYGNLYRNGFMTRDVSHTGWGDQFDFIIVHESGHEWFANNITYRDMADMWIHESFTAYSESLFTEYHFGREAGYEYVRGTRANIANDRPIIGNYDVNHAGSGDMYPKGANMLHTLRQMVNSDSSWRAMLRGLNERFYHQVVTTEQVEQYIALFTGFNLDAFFDQYLRDVRIPVLEYDIRSDGIKYRWNSCIEAFDMPVRVWIDGSARMLNPTSNWQRLDTEKEVTAFRVDENYYVAGLSLQPPSEGEK